MAEEGRGRTLPSRWDIDPIEIPRLLPHIMLVDVMGPSLYRYRLVGTEIATTMGVNATGCSSISVTPLAIGISWTAAARRDRTRDALAHLALG